MKFPQILKLIRDTLSDVQKYVDDEQKKLYNIHCPVCGYYCLGKGGRGCIDKPTLTGLSQGKEKDA